MNDPQLTTWKTNNQLRWYIARAPSHLLSYGGWDETPVLQQLWFSNTGKYKWEDIPTVRWDDEHQAKEDA